MTSRFAPARRAFALLSASLRNDPELKGEVEEAFRLLLTRFDTTVYENRFVVGGVAERIVAATFVAIGQPAVTEGVVVTRTDIKAGDANLSVKGVFRRAYSVRLVNVMGKSTRAAWNEGTIVVLTGVGIGYADPDLLPDATKRVGDALVLPLKPVKALWQRNPDLLLQLAIPMSRADMQNSDVPSRLVADEIFRYLKRLRPFDPRSAAQ